MFLIIIPMVAFQIFGPEKYLETVKKYADDLQGVTKAEELIFSLAEKISWKIEE